MRQQYDRVAIGLHWTIALLILIAFVLGLTVDDFPNSCESTVVNIHSLLGLAVLALTVGRLAWRLGHMNFPPMRFCFWRGAMPWRCFTTILCCGTPP